MNYEQYLNRLIIPMPYLAICSNVEYAPFPRHGGHGQVVYKNKLWIIGGAENVDPYSDVWYLE